MDEKAVRGIPWTILTYGATKIITVLTTLVLARLLAPADFGLFALATLGISLLSIFNGAPVGIEHLMRFGRPPRRFGHRPLRCHWSTVIASYPINACALAFLAGRQAANRTMREGDANTSSSLGSPSGS
jgi:Polysaccharide biosynthesis protein